MARRKEPEPSPPKKPKSATAWFPAVDGGEKAWRMLPVWLAVAFAVRATFALGGDFVLHPDEIMQYLEPAHRAVFGSGVVFWEFYFGGRSWLVPGTVAAILWTLDQVGLGVPWVYVYVVKVFFCLLSLLVPWGCYLFARRVVGEQPARMALIIVSLWPYIAIFSHKPFTEFVSTSIIMGALGVACLRPGNGLKSAVAFGALLALASAVRVQYLPVCGIIWLARSMGANLRWAGFSVGGGLAMLAFVGAFEAATWGSPFRSYYVNIVINNALDDLRGAQDLGFYFGRLLFATAGGIAVAVWAMAAQPRRHWMIAAITLVTLALHVTQSHKELRFVYVVTVLWAIPFSAQLHQWTSKLKDATRRRVVAAASAAFLVVAGSNLLPDRWLHTANSLERDQISYLFGQTNMFDVYLDLARTEDVKGVIHLGDPYFNTPGYYYLHHDVPLYNDSMLEYAFQIGGLESVQEAASHVVSKQPVADLLPLESRSLGEYKAYFDPDVKEVRRWVQHSPLMIGEVMFKLARRHLRHTETQMPQTITFVD